LFWLLEAKTEESERTAAGGEEEETWIGAKIEKELLPSTLSLSLSLCERFLCVVILFLPPLRKQSIHCKMQASVHQ